MNHRNIHQIAKKLLQASILMAEAEQIVNQLEGDKAERYVRIRNAMNQLADGRAIILKALEEVRKTLDEDSN